MALKMIERCGKDGRLKPGGTIVEGTSENTGMNRIDCNCKRVQINLCFNR